MSADTRVLGPGVRLAPAPHTYFALYDGEIVVLDAQRDRYLALGPKTSQELQRTLEQPSSGFEPTSEVLAPLIEQDLLVSTSAGARPMVLAEPAEPGGLASYAWSPHLSPAALSGAPGDAWWSARGVLWIAAAHRRARGDGVGAVLRWLRAWYRSASCPEHPEVPVASLVVAHLHARMVYSRQIQCLAGSAALAAHAWALGVPVTFVIGVQKYPFLAHAWVQQAGRVLNDRVDVASRLSPIVRVGAEAEE